MRYLITFLILVNSIVQGQDKESEQILLPIHNMFLGMEKGDSALVHSAFFTDVSLTTVVEKEKEIKLRREGLQEFLNAVGGPHKVQWHEPIWDEQVQVDGNFAQVWAAYAFYAGTTFSHCGVDTFQLVKTADGWKIFYLADTRKKEGCKVPDHITKKYASK